MRRQSDWMRGLQYAESLVGQFSAQHAWQELELYQGFDLTDFDRGARDYLFNLMERKREIS